MQLAHLKDEKENASGCGHAKSRFEQRRMLSSRLEFVMRRSGVRPLHGCTRCSCPATAGCTFPLSVVAAIRCLLIDKRVLEDEGLVGPHIDSFPFPFGRLEFPVFDRSESCHSEVICGG